MLLPVFSDMFKIRCDCLMMIITFAADSDGSHFKIGQHFSKVLGKSTVGLE